MLDVVTPTCRAISAIDNPNSSRPRLAIVARRVLPPAAAPFEFVHAYAFFLSLFFDDFFYCLAASLEFELVFGLLLGFLKDGIHEIAAPKNAFVEFFFPAASPGREDLGPAAFASDEPAVC